MTGRPRSSARSARDARPALCPCGSGAGLPECCGPLHSGAAAASTPEQLMRSRYSAFVLRDEAYLLRSWHPRTRPGALRLEDGVRWLRLEILASDDGGPFGASGTVEFRAYFSDDGRPGELHEKSRFVRHQGAWVYVDGDVEPGT